MTAVPPALDTGAASRSVGNESPQIVDDQGVHLLAALPSGERIHIVRTVEADQDRLAALIPLDHSGFGRVEAVLRLLASLYGRAVPSDPRLTHQKRLRTKRMLRAFDGRRAGASQKAIASAIFRLASMSRDEWQSAPARFATRSLIRDGVAMVAGGYRKLLQRQHR